MKIILNNKEKTILARTSREEGVDPKKLFDVYAQVMECNFEQDVWDVLAENREELGGHDYEREAYEQNLAYDKMRKGD